MKGSNSTYFGHVKETVSSLLQGLRLSFRHLREAKKSRKPVGIEDDTYFEQQTGIVTLQYPKESFPVPDNGRYQLHNEIEDCIVCDKCAKICPVDCIEIEPVKAVEEIGKTSDGTPKRLYAAKFDIDMGKCCFCGLCTTVCPTECLTMTKAYDFSAYDSADHIYAFSEMSPLEILQKKKEQEAHKQQKEAEKAAKPTAGGKPGAARPKAVPPIAARPKPAAEGKEEGEEAKAIPRPAFKPKIKPSSEKKEASGLTQAGARPAAEAGDKKEEEKSGAEPRPRFRPKIKGSTKLAAAGTPPKAEEKAKKTPEEQGEESPAGTERKEPSGSRPRPSMNPKVKRPALPEEKEEGESKHPKPARPLIRPKVKAKEEGSEEAPSEEPKRPRPLVKPTGVPKKPSEEEKSTSDKQEEKKVKPVYRPKPIIRKKKNEE